MEYWIRGSMVMTEDKSTIDLSTEMTAVYVHRIS